QLELETHRFDDIGGIKILETPHSGRVGLQKQSPSGFASLGDGNRHPQLDSPPVWARKVVAKDI
ncbi:MAG: hypothetical protein AAFY21_06025, partial [Cyanobacteria bacterium J06641_2]